MASRGEGGREEREGGRIGEWTGKERMEVGREGGWRAFFLLLGIPLIERGKDKKVQGSGSTESGRNRSAKETQRKETVWDSKSPPSFEASSTSPRPQKSARGRPSERWPCSEQFFSAFFFSLLEIPILSRF